MKTLYIDTTSNTEIIVSLTINGEKDEVKRGLEQRKAQVLLPIIEELLKKHRLKLQDLDEIEVNHGPGSFTGVRVGVSVANALSYALGIPVNGINVAESEKIVEPVYE